MPPQSRNFRGTGPHACIYYLFNIGADCSETLAFDQFFRKISEELFVHDRLQLRAVIIRNAFEMSFVLYCNSGELSFNDPAWAPAGFTRGGQ